MKLNGYKGKYIGLNSNQVIDSRKKHGANQLEATKKDNLLTKVIHLFKEPMFLLLAITATIYFALGSISDGAIMLVFVVFVSGIDIFQEWRTEKALQALKTLSSLNTKAVRNNKVVEISSDDLVVGDIVILDEGDKIPADGDILECYSFGVDESSLTGESEIVFKTSKDIDDNDHWKKNMCYAGTSVTSGGAVIKITSVGFSTEYGKIGAALNSIVRAKTPLEKQVRKLITICAYISMLLCTAVIVVDLLNNPNNYVDWAERITHSVLAGITVAMATIPEELPVVLTVFLAMGAWGLVKRNTLVKSIPTVEALGAVSVLCVDKTGTLTANEMSIQEIYVDEDSTEEEVLEISALACKEDSYDPMEKAILTCGFEKCLDKNSLFDHELVHEYPFLTEFKMVGRIWNFGDSSLLCVKGAYENVLPLCNLEDGRKKKIEKKILSLSKQGYRILAIAKQSVDVEVCKKITDHNLTFLGLIALADPLREGVADSIKECYDAGIRVIMITGDNGETAKGIARQMGLRYGSNVITGVELEAMSDEELREKVKTTDIFARVYPTHKMRIVEALQSDGHIVAMTGDGVNDAPALKRAEVGIAISKKSTSVAKEAADMILLDNDFEIIVDAIKNGRRIYGNIKKAIMYIFIVHIPIALISLMVPMLNYPELLLPVHVVLLELIIDPMSSIVFERLKADKDIMKKKPRSVSESLVTLKMLCKSLTQGIIVSLVIIGSYIYLIDTSCSQAYASTFAIIILLFFNVLTVYMNQSDDYMLVNIIKNLKDEVIVLISALILLGLTLIVYLPTFNTIFKTQSLSLTHFLIAFALAFLSVGWYDIVKLFNRKRAMN